MIEGKMDRYLRREDTGLAALIKRVSPSVGADWDKSRIKRGMELSIALPAAIVSTPIVAVLVAANKALYEGNALFIQKRVRQKGQETPVIKIRCMKSDAEYDSRTSLSNSANYSASEDPRNTTLGKLMRKFDVEESPQLLQVLAGQWRLIGIRSAPQYVFDYIEKTKPRQAPGWKEAYFSAVPGLFSLNGAVNPNSKDDTKRIDLDCIQAKKASLGLDLYIMYRYTVKGIGSLLRNKQGRKVKIPETSLEMISDRVA